MNKEEALLKFFDISRPTLYKWKREKRPVSIFIDKYLNHNDVVEFLHFGKVKRLEDTNKYSSIIQSLENIINNFDYFQRNILYVMCSKFLKENDEINASTYNFQLYFTINGFSDIVNNTNYFPNEDTKKSVLDFYKSNNKKFDIDEIKKIQVFSMFEEVVKLNDVLIKILLAEYKTLIDLNFDGVKIPVN